MTGLFLLLGGIVWGFIPISSDVGVCGSVFIEARDQVRQTGPTSWTYTPRPEGCGQVRDDHRTPVYLLVFVGSAMAAGAFVGTRGERTAVAPTEISDRPAAPDPSGER